MQCTAGAVGRYGGQVLSGLISMCVGCFLLLFGGLATFRVTDYLADLRFHIVL